MNIVGSVEYRKLGALVRGKQISVPFGKLHNLWPGCVELGLIFMTSISMVTPQEPAKLISCKGV